MALWTVYLSLCLLVALNASVESRPVENKNTICGVCKAGWSAFGCRCYKFFNYQYIWTNAEYMCLYYNGNLASVHSHEEYMFIQKLVRQTTHASTPTWIGGHDAIRWGNWFWSDGSSFGYQLWSPGQPSYSTNEDCIEMNSVNGNWNDVNCYENKPFVCAY
ncbi:galactose-specific lectin nattectin-like isoform X5 [Ctenopharyngodon idella]|uniref:galactose-specific lectin nattectin-like isoform X5 n=1 Tax=Ctenopharyngodon idella TaxID=7959 RepID=UPI0022321C1E|nr:galactose-specific lectin nattectin-like isoform X5 [Ctenopharyngodon idella]